MSLRRVRHFSSFIDGGAGHAAGRLHESLRSIGVDSRFAYSVDRNRGKPVDQLDASFEPQTFQTRRWAEWASRQWSHRKFKSETRNQPAGRDLFTTPVLRRDTRIETAGLTSDEVIHLHWIAKFLDWPSFFGSLPPQQPIVWTLHDMNPLTGGCHFSAGCDSFSDKCGSCFQLRGPKPDDVSRVNWMTKRQALRDVNLHVVAPSRWLVEQAQRSGVMERARSFHHIPYSIDADEFRPVDGDELRRSLGIDPAKFVIAFGAMGVQSVRKGFRQLTAALSKLSDRDDIHLLVFGRGSLPTGDVAMPPVSSMGMVCETETLRAIYSAADVFALPSLEDNLPLTGLEAMACGTPLVAFDAGGIPDYVRPFRTGLLAKTGDSDHLQAQLRWAAEHRDKVRQMGRTARQMIESEYATPHEASAYRNLYDAIIDGEFGNLPEATDRRAA